MAQLREMLPRSPHSTTVKIARLRGSTEAQAREFCQSVQHLIGPKPPSFKTILACLKRNRRATAEQIADILATEGANLSEQQDRFKKEALVRKPNSSRGPNRGTGRNHSGSSDLWVDQLSTPSPISRHDPRRFERGLKTCKHGVLMTQVCAICNPEKFAQVNGPD